MANDKKTGTDAVKVKPINYTLPPRSSAGLANALGRTQAPQGPASAPTAGPSGGPSIGGIGGGMGGVNFPVGNGTVGVGGNFGKVGVGAKFGFKKGGSTKSCGCGPKKMAKGGSVSKRADGCATKGKTKGKFV